MDSRNETIAGFLRSGVATAATESATHSLQEMLAAIRSHLNMDVAFISEFSAGNVVLRHVDSPHENQPVQVGLSAPTEKSYCQRVVDGRLPELIRDTSALIEATQLAATSAIPVGAHLSVPIRLK